MSEASSSAIPGFDALTSYRDWLGSQSRLIRLLLVFVVFVVLGGWGLAVETLQATITPIVTQILTWIVFLAALYTLYGLARSLVK